MFIDRAKQARGWLNGSNFDAVPTANLNSEGALASLPAGQTSVKFFFNSMRDGGGSYVGTPPDRGGRFRFSITGGASGLSVSGGSNLTQINATTWEFDCPWIGNAWITLTPTAFPIKATLVRTDRLAAHGAGEIFDPDWLAHLPSGGCFRAMSWNNSNGSNRTEWTQENTLASQRWYPVPYEVITALCVAKNADAWVSMPYAASDAYFTACATYLRDNFPANKKIRIELSNEIWNTVTFPATATHFKNLAESVWGVPDGYINPGGAWMHYAGKRFAQMMQIFNSVFAGQTHRLIGVLGAQAGDVSMATRVADATLWQTYEPGSYVPPRTLAKELSIAPYINWAGIGATAHGNNIKAQLDISQAAAVAYIKGMIPASLTQARGWIDNHVPLAANRGLRLTVYEYNNHYDLFACSGSTLYSGGNPVPGALAAFMEATYSQEMANAQDDLRAYWKSQNGSLMTFFLNMVRASQFGTWGAKTHLEHDSPIWNDLLSWHVANPRWWAQ